MYYVLQQLLHSYHGTQSVLAISAHQTGEAKCLKSEIIKQKYVKQEIIYNLVLWTKLYELVLVPTIICKYGYLKYYHDYINIVKAPNALNFNGQEQQKINFSGVFTWIASNTIAACLAFNMAGPVVWKFVTVAQLGPSHEQFTGIF